MMTLMVSSSRFLSTPSARRATDSVRSLSEAGIISIHALREEGDCRCRPPWRPPYNFYPRPPRGGRPMGKRRSRLPRRISIHALREEGDDHEHRVEHAARMISIHALREEGDFRSSHAPPAWETFLSTPSARRATSTPGTDSAASIFLSTPSARRATRMARASTSLPRNFYPRPPRGGRQQKQRQNLYFQTNYTTFCTNLEEP